MRLAHTRCMVKAPLSVNCCWPPLGIASGVLQAKRVEETALQVTTPVKLQLLDRLGWVPEGCVGAGWSSSAYSNKSVTGICISKGLESLSTQVRVIVVNTNLLQALLDARVQRCETLLAGPAAGDAPRREYALALADALADAPESTALSAHVTMGMSLWALDRRGVEDVAFEGQSVHALSRFPQHVQHVCRPRGPGAACSGRRPKAHAGSGRPAGRGARARRRHRRRRDRRGPDRARRRWGAWRLRRLRAAPHYPGAVRSSLPCLRRCCESVAAAQLQGDRGERLRRPRRRGTGAVEMLVL